MRAIAALTLILFLAPTIYSQSDEEKNRASTLGQDVNLAIKKGIEYIRKEQKEGGPFKDENDPYVDGYTGLSMLALLKSGIPPSDPAIRNALKYIQSRPYTKIYSAAARIMALEALQDREMTGEILAAAEWLLKNFHDKEGEWAYPDGRVDLSNTQYAVLGLWTAERHGFKTPAKIWERLASAVIDKHQGESGGFTYSPDGDDIKGSMTCAGLFVLMVCLDNLKKNPELRQAIEKGWDYLDRRYSPAGNPLGDHIFTKDRLYYYLYSLERCCALANMQKIGGKDWYREGASEIVKDQNDNGSWHDSIDKTCFALLFLKKSTYTTIKKKHDTNLKGMSGKKKDNKIRPSHEIPFVKNWLLLGPFDNAKEVNFTKDLIHEKEADPREGTRYKKRKWRHHRSLSSTICLEEVISKDNRTLAYGFTRLRAAVDTEALIWFGSSDGARIFLDGELVFDHPYLCIEGPDTHSIPVTLTRGDHRLLVKIMHHSYEWRLALRISGPDGAPLQGLMFFTDPDGPATMERFDNESPFLSPWEIFNLLPLDRNAVLDFSSASDLDRLYMEHNFHLKPLEKFSPKKTGRRSRRDPKGMAVAFKIRDRNSPVTFFRRVKVPTKRYQLAARLSVQTPNSGNETDWIARLGVFDSSDGEDGSIRWFDEELISSKTEEFSGQSQEITAALDDHAGHEVLILLECVEGGPANDGGREKGFIHEFSIKPK
jgi:hypothetical protein